MSFLIEGTSTVSLNNQNFWWGNFDDGEGDITGLDQTDWSWNIATELCP